MIHRQRRMMRSVFAAFIALASVGLAAGPAQAATKWYTFDRWCGSMQSLTCSVQYTGSWPGGQARGEGSVSDYKVILQTRVGTSGSYTAGVAIGKDNWYRTCIQLVSGGQLNCIAPEGSIYLGDG
jgi:hypothetical protein